MRAIKGKEEFMLFDAFSRVLRNDIASYAFVVDAKDDKSSTHSLNVS
jgi:hypothetical protein